MAYFNYHGIAKRLLREGRLEKGYIVKNHRGIHPALILFFDDEKHPVMPIRPHRFEEYAPLLQKEKIRLQDESLMEHEVVFRLMISLS